MKRAVVGKILHHLFLRELQVLLVAHTEFRDQETTIIPTMKISLIMFQKFLTQLQLLFQNLRWRFLHPFDMFRHRPSTMMPQRVWFWIFVAEAVAVVLGSSVCVCWVRGREGGRERRERKYVRHDLELVFHVRLTFRFVLVGKKRIQDISSIIPYRMKIRLTFQHHRCVLKRLLRVHTFLFLGQKRARQRSKFR